MLVAVWKKNCFIQFSLKHSTLYFREVFLVHLVNPWKSNMLETQVMFSKVNYPEFYF